MAGRSATSESSDRSPFPSYLLPSLSYQFSVPPAFRRRQSSLSSNGTESVPSLSFGSLDATRVSHPSTPVSTPPTGFFSRMSFSKTRKPSVSLLSIDEMSYTPPVRLDQTGPDTLRCSTCANDIAFTTQIVSKGFTGRHGRAYLVSAPTRSPSAGILTPTTASSDLTNVLVARPVNRQLVTGAHVVADISCQVCNTVLGWKYVNAKDPAQRYKIGKFILETHCVVGDKRWEDIDIDVCGRQDLLIEEEISVDEDAILFDSDDEDECEELFAGSWDPQSVMTRRSRRVGRR